MAARSGSRAKKEKAVHSTSDFHSSEQEIGDDHRTVLVVDDDQDLRSLVALVLEEEGYKVETAANGRQGLDAVNRSMPDLILLDMKMPVMDGWEFAREFRARYDLAAPIVVLTAAADAKKRAEETGAIDWIGKPFDLDTLLNVVGRDIRKGHAN